MLYEQSRKLRKSLVIVFNLNLILTVTVPTLDGMQSVGSLHYTAWHSSGLTSMTVSSPPAISCSTCRIWQWGGIPLSSCAAMARRSVDLPAGTKSKRAVEVCMACTQVYMVMKGGMGLHAEYAGCKAASKYRMRLHVPGRLHSIRCMRLNKMGHEAASKYHMRLHMPGRPAQYQVHVQTPPCRARHQRVPGRR